MQIGMQVNPADPPLDAWPALYAAGSSVAQIAGLTGYPELQVRQELRARGVTVRPPGRRRGSMWWSSGWHETAAAMLARGYTYAAIAGELGQSQPAVRSAVRRAGLRTSAGEPGRSDPAVWVVTG
jgi:hypothetical protein